VVGGDFDMRWMLFILLVAGGLAGCASTGGHCSGSYSVCMTRQLNAETSNAIRGLDNDG
jgi:hypothetical protein